MTYWLDWAKRNVAPVTSGSYTEGRWKLLIHTTETDTFTPNSSSYYGHQGWPHLTNTRDGIMWQHIDLDIAARALKNYAGGVETNRSRVIQVENVARSINGDNALTEPQIANLRRLVIELRDKRGMEMQVLPAGAIPGSASADAPQRMSFDKWRTYSGICAHRHAPENDHWDSGAFDLSRLLPQPEPVPPVEEEYMIRKGDGPSQYIRSFQFMLNRFFTDTGGQPGTGWVVKDGIAGAQTFAATWEAVLRLSEPPPGFAGTAQVDFRSNGITGQDVLEREGIDPVLVAAITAAAGIR